MLCTTNLLYVRFVVMLPCLHPPYSHTSNITCTRAKQGPVETLNYTSNKHHVDTRGAHTAREKNLPTCRLALCSSSKTCSIHVWTYSRHWHINDSCIIIDHHHCDSMSRQVCDCVVIIIIIYWEKEQTTHLPSCFQFPCDSRLS